MADQRQRKRRGKDDRSRTGISRDRVFDKEAWKPTTSLGLRVKNGEIVDIDEILDRGLQFLEAEIVDALLPELQTDLLEVGQSKGKFGGGKPSIWRQTQKKTKEGNKPSFATIAVVGNGNGYVGIGFGKAKEILVAATAEGVMTLIAGASIVRFAPSLVIPDADIIEGMSRLEKAIAKIAS